jgi:hypothetical protein
MEALLTAFPLVDETTCPSSRRVCAAVNSVANNKGRNKILFMLVVLFYGHKRSVLNFSSAIK